MFLCEFWIIKDCMRAFVDVLLKINYKMHGETIKTFSVLQTVPLSQEKSGIKTDFLWHYKF